MSVSSVSFDHFFRYTSNCGLINVHGPFFKYGEFQHSQQIMLEMIELFEEENGSDEKYPRDETREMAIWRAVQKKAGNEHSINNPESEPTKFRVKNNFIKKFFSPIVPNLTRERGSVTRRIANVMSYVFEIPARLTITFIAVQALNVCKYFAKKEEDKDWFEYTKFRLTINAYDPLYEIAQKVWQSF